MTAGKEVGEIEGEEKDPLDVTLTQRSITPKGRRKTTILQSSPASPAVTNDAATTLGGNIESSFSPRISPRA